MAHALGLTEAFCQPMSCACCCQHESWSRVLPAIPKVQVMRTLGILSGLGLSRSLQSGHHASGAVSTKVRALLHEPCKLAGVRLHVDGPPSSAVLRDMSWLPYCRCFDLYQYSHACGHHASGALSAQFSAVLHNPCKLAAVHDCFAVLHA